MTTLNPFLSSYKLSRLTLALSLFCLPATVLADTAAHAADAKAEKDIERVQVTGVVLNGPGQLVMDPKAPRQPLPAHDGADYLKTIPGFSVTRKGGADGDAVFRGMAGSRLGILVDGENILGGCNFRMDAPTAYIYPELHDSMTVIKGPQSVAHGAGHSAAVILFDRNVAPFEQAGFRTHSSLTTASFGRHDELADLQFGQQNGYVLLSGSNSTSDDYQDGDGNDVHSRYQRYSGNIAVGWTPDVDTKVELSGARSDGEAAYADRGMDGTRFRRDSLNLRVEKTNITPWLEQVKFHWFDNEVDHLMDDQQLRKPGMMGYANLLRDTKGGRLSAIFTPSMNYKVTLGADQQDSGHRSRSAPASGVFSALLDDAEISQVGVFAEWRFQLAQFDAVAAGYRLDQWQATDERLKIAGMMSPMPNPTAGQRRDDDLHSGFARYEHQFSAIPASWYIGVGSTARFPDYWELIAKEGIKSKSAFLDIAPEQTTQLDTGYLFKNAGTEWSVSAFYNEISDYILVDYSNMMKSNGFVRNIDASSYGAELGVQQKFSHHWQSDVTVAYTRGDNDTDGTALPQISPLEIKLGLSYAQDNWSVGSLVRIVGAQSYFDRDKGNIVGKDLGSTPGFAVVSFNGSWRPVASLLLTAGVDNLLDRTYAEFVSRAAGNGMGGGIPGYVQTLRVNEPGRTAWLKAQWNWDGQF
ncbi:TonB-dependent copper receptor [Rheinheimera tilapiae]|uniref:TonB-dependent copper receptor n=2 Tax=Bacteria TaxID=2 RepID=A0ABV6BCA0_9GAMM